MSGKKGSSGAFQYPWDDLDSIKNPDELFRRDDIEQKLFALGYPKLRSSPTAKKFKSVIDKLLARLDPEKADGKWYLLVASDPTKLTQLQYVLPQCYAHTYSQAVHNISWPKFAKLMDGDESVTPLGPLSLKRAGLIVFENLWAYSKKDLWSAADMLEYFIFWARSEATVCFTSAYNGESWDQREGEVLFEMIAAHIPIDLYALLLEKIQILDLKHFARPTRFPGLEVLD